MSDKTSTKKNNLPIRERAAQAAAAGDLESLFHLLTYPPQYYMFKEEPAEFLKQAFAVVVQNGTPSFIEALVMRMLQFDAEFLFRAQIAIDRKMRAADDYRCLHSGPPQEVSTEDLPRLLAIEDRLIAIMKNYASIKHVLNLPDRAPKKPKANIIPLDDRDEPNVAAGK